MSDIRRILVVGSGVGGLTAAATFARRGVEVVLIERRPAFDIPGVGLGQPANALRVYDTLGVLDEILKERLAQYGSYVAEIAASLNSDSDIVYSPIEPLMLPWPWFRGRVVIGGDAAHTFAPHLTQGAAMAAEDALVLAREVLDDDVPVEARLMRYSMKRYPRCAFVYTFSGQWLHDEQSVRSAQELEAARAELTLNASARIGASDRILNGPI